MSPEFFQRHKIGVFLFIYLSFSILFLTLRVDSFVNGIKTSVWFFVSPDIVYTGRFFNRFDSLRGRLFDLIRVSGENFILREQNSRLSQAELERDALEIENNRLRTLLTFKQKTFPNAIPAEVIVRDLREWFHSFVINKGSRDGIVSSAAVIAWSGDRSTLVGRVIDVSPTTSKVLLLTDVVSAISVGFPTKSDLGLLEGRNAPTVVLNYLSPQTTVIPGDDVVTAGLSGLFPAGIPIGRVVDIRSSKDGFFKEAKVLPYTDFGSVQEVLVISRQNLPELLKQ